MLTSILNHYASIWRGDITQGESGWNNTTRFVEGPEGRGVLRIYQTHRDLDKIRFEHAVLASLAQSNLGFSTPVPVPSLTGDTVVQLEDGSGRYACLFKYIDGIRPKAGGFRAAYSFGEAAGSLSYALSRIVLETSPAYRPYYEIAHSYPAFSPERVGQFCIAPPEPFRDLEGPLRGIGEAYGEVSRELEGLERLPQQLVHGDLNVSNLLVGADKPEQVTALLDFEFCTRDVRAMEPAVILPGLLGDDKDAGMEAAVHFCRGFGSRVRLTREEIRAVPVLMKLRNVDVFLHFMTRYDDGTDGPEVLREQIPAIRAELARLERDRTTVEALLERYLSSE
ncbi:phosphotransferase [Paenibacillus sp. XY044]|uniref:phosphotransferase n=1 Tax=Paenibacillus sp. XY044 TaxID=2026089 RepID=UPI000B98DAA8|nr:phosphotransferase [Paenibacillus sp. XY044]OZB95004.1 aminoglycoside phosphotransferase [Paenibacillus sp. XY044]